MVIGTITLLCLLTKSVFPLIGFALAWIPNYPLFLAAVSSVIRLPPQLEKVHSIEPVLYRWAGAGLVKSIVTSRAWPLLVGLEAPKKETSRSKLLESIENWAKVGEVVHGVAFMFAAFMALFCFAIGGTSAAFWISIFNLGLNGYPVMLQRSHRWRLQQLHTRQLLNNRRTKT